MIYKQLTQFHTLEKNTLVNLLANFSVVLLRLIQLLPVLQLYLSGWYFVEWKKRPRAFHIQINGKDLYLASEFPTRWLTENFEEELEKLTSENSL